MLFLVFRFLVHPARRHVLWLIGLAASVIIAGGIAFAIAEHLHYWIGLYWSVTTATTVGYGDVTPHTGAGHVIAVVVMLTTIPILGAVLAIWSGAAAAARLRRMLHMGRAFPQGTFRLIVGMSPVVPAMLDELVETGHDVVLVADVDPVTVRDEVHLVRGDPTSEQALKTAQPGKAEHALVTGAADGDVLVSVVLLRAAAPNLAMTALVHSRPTADALKDLGVNQTISTDDLLSHTLAKSLESPHAGSLLMELLDSERHTLDELEATPDMAGKALSSLRNERDDLVLGLVHGEAISLGIGEDPVVVAGDLLLVARPIAAAGRSRARTGATGE